MLYNHLKIAFRNLWRNRLFTTINVAGLAVGLACVLLVYIIYHTVTSIDGFHQKSDRIYVVEEQSPGHPASQLAVAPLLPTILQTIPGVEAGTRLLDGQSLWLSANGREFNESITYVDPGIFDVFTFPLRYGDPKTALREPNSIVLSEKVSQKLFGNQNPLGKIIEIDASQAYVIRGVLEKIPANATFTPSILLPTTALALVNPARLTSWYNADTPTYLLLREGISPGAIEKLLPAIVRKHYHKEAQKRRLSFLPYPDLYAKQQGPLFTVIMAGLAFVGLFILLIISINFLNLTSAASLARMSEVAMRTAMGAGRWQVIAQFVLETFIVATIASGLGLLLLDAVLPRFLSYFEIEFLPLALTANTLWVAIGLVAVTALLAGVYPALHLTSLNVSRSLRGQRTTSATRTPLRNTLVVVQFTLAVVLMAGTLVMQQQITHVRHVNTGLSLDDVVVIDLDLAYRNEETATSQVNSVLDELRRNPNVAAFSTSGMVPGRWWVNEGEFAVNGADKKIAMQQATVDQGFLQAYSIRLHEGRNFTANIASDSIDNVLINRQAMQRLGWQSGVGKRITDGFRTYTIVGVIDDFYYRGTHKRLQPLVLHGSGVAKRQGNAFLSIKAREGQAAIVLAAVQEQFKSIPSRLPFRSVYAHDQYEKLYWIMTKSLAFNAYAAFITLLLSCAGIFGLASFTTQQRIKEIGIRKVMGASLKELVYLLSRRLLRLVLISFVIAAPLVYLMMSQWLQTFSNQINFPWLTVALAGVITLIVAFLTTGVLSVKAALMNPAKSLRAE